MVLIMIKFTAETKCSGINLKDGTEIRKGAFDAIRKIALSAGNLSQKKRKISFKPLQVMEVLHWW